MARIFRARVQYAVQAQVCILTLSYQATTEAAPDLGAQAVANGLGFADADGTMRVAADLDGLAAAMRDLVNVTTRN